MADKSSSKRKKPVSQKRVAIVLAALVATMTVFAAALLAMEGAAPGTAVPVMATTHSNLLPAIALRPEPWRFIIIYQSVDSSASAGSLAEGRFVSGGTGPSVRPRANFHFVIDGADSGVGMDGNLEIGTSWNNQHAGAPYASWPDPRSNSFTPYTNAVGVCLAADLNRKPISEAQHQKLLSLVRELQQLSSIPADQVKFHWEITPDARPSMAQRAYAERFRQGL
jgi:hypothetical protein